MLLETRGVQVPPPSPHSSLFGVRLRLSDCVMPLATLHREMDAKDKRALEEEIVRRAEERRREEEGPCAGL